MIIAANKLSVGDVELVALTDHEGDFPMRLSQVSPTVPADAWEPFRQRYPELFSGPDTWRNHYGCYLLRSQGRTILVGYRPREQGHLAEENIGVWELQSWATVVDDKAIDYPFGQKSSGFLV